MKAPSFGIMADGGLGGNEVSRELEIALVLSAIEKYRAKGGLLRRKLAEYAVFVSQLLWPFYFLERRDNRALVVFDGLGLFELRLTYPAISQCDEFEAQLTQAISSETPTSTLLEVLSRHAKTFKEFANVTSYPVAGCITDQDLISDLVQYSKTTSAFRSPPETLALSPRISSDVANSSLNTLFQLLRGKAQADIERLNAVAKSLTESSARWLSRLEDQKMEIARRYSERTQEIRPDIEQKVKKHHQDLRQQTGSVEEKYAPIISNFEAETSRWEAEEKRWKRMKAGFSRSLASARRARKAAQGRAAKAIKDRDREAQKLLKYYTALVEQEWQTIRDMEKERDQLIQEQEAAKKQILKLSTHIAEDIGRLLQRKQRVADSTAEQSDASYTWNVDLGDVVGVYVPFWVAFLESGKGARFIVLPPVNIKRSKGFIDRVSRLLGWLTLPLRPRTKRFESMLKKRLEQALSSNPDLQQEMVEKGTSNNILRDPATRIACNEGLQRLVDTGWIDTKQAVRISDALESQRY